jgi:hypothetical protein
VEHLEGRSLLNATSTVAWNIGGVSHTALYAIAQNDTVEVSVDGGPFANLGGYAKQVSAGLDAFNKPEVYAIGADNTVSVNKGSGWINLGGYAKAISATIENTIYAIGGDDQLYLNHGTPGLSWVNLGGSTLGGGVRQISAGVDAIGNPRVYVIGYDNAVYVNWGIGGFTNLFFYAKEISAATHDFVYAIGPHDDVYKIDGGGSGYTALGGYAKQISAGIDSTFGPFVFAIGLNDGLWSNHGAGWVSFGSTYVTDISAPSVGNFGVSLPADLTYAVAQGHGALLHQGASFSSIGGYVQTPSGSATNDTNSWEPAARDVSAVSWFGPFFLRHNALYAIAPNDTVEVSFAGGPFKNLGGYAKQVSAGLDATGSPEVYAIGADDSVWVNDGAGWVSLHFYAKQISATVRNTVYAIGTDDAVWVDHGSGWVHLAVSAKQISAGTDTAGNPEVFAIGYDDAVYVDGTSGIVGRLGGYAKQISATGDNTVYAIGGNNAVFEYTPDAWVPLGGYAKQISASLDASGNPEVFAIGSGDTLWVNHGSGWVSEGPNTVLEVSAPAVDAGLSGDLAYAVGIGHVGLLHQGTSFTTISGGSVE